MQVDDWLLWMLTVWSVAWCEGRPRRKDRTSETTNTDTTSLRLPVRNQNRTRDWHDVRMEHLYHESFIQDPYNHTDDVLYLKDQQSPQNVKFESKNHKMNTNSQNDKSKNHKMNTNLLHDQIEPNLLTIPYKHGTKNTYEIVMKSTRVKRRLPTALIIGVKKGGTRALLEFTRVHPDVRAPGREIHFFDRHYDRGLKWYRRQMPPSLGSQVTMEKTPCYFVTPDTPSRIAAMSNTTKLIVVVRDPVTRLISDYTQTATKFPSTKPFEDMALLDKRTGAVDTSWAAIRIGMYSEHLKTWLRHFPLKQILFVGGERLIEDPASELARVQEFLGLKQIITDKHFFFDDVKGFPCLKKHEGSGRPHCLGKSKGRRHPTVKQSVIRNLRTFYRPFNVELYNMVGHDFGWT